VTVANLLPYLLLTQNNKAGYRKKIPSCSLSSEISSANAEHVFLSY